MRIWYLLFSSDLLGFSFSTLRATWQLLHSCSPDCDYCCTNFWVRYCPCWLSIVTISESNLLAAAANTYGSVMCSCSLGWFYALGRSSFAQAHLWKRNGSNLSVCSSMFPSKALKGSPSQYNSHLALLLARSCCSHIYQGSSWYCLA